MPLVAIKLAQVSPSGYTIIHRSPTSDTIASVFILENIFPCSGARGGGFSGGAGALMQGTFNLTQGDILHILVGESPLNVAPYPGGGGGMTI